ncbi:class I SAM-dependent methyltransferase, partial [Patescibacteria group bacterium]|nr:class I SAM-dependent methyltransferase [Patescibacteria group bacterium]
HRQRHGSTCTVYPTGSGSVLAALVAATHASRILEVGCGLGYSALWLAFGSAPDGHVETVEQDASHVELARRHFDQEGYGQRITIHQGTGDSVLPQLSGPYEFIFCDGDIDEYLVDLDHFLRLLEPGGLLVTANLFLGQHDPDIPGLDQAATYRHRILDERRLVTAFLPTGLALSVRKQD